MPNDLERAFAALSDDTSRSARLAPAADLRKRGDRQTVIRSVAGVAAAVVLVAGVAVGSRLATTDKALPPLPPAQSGAPSVAPAPPVPSSAVSSPASSAGSTFTPIAPASSAAGEPDREPAGTVTPTFPTAIPVEAFLSTADTGGGQLTRVDRDEQVNPPHKLCPAAPAYATERRARLGASRQILYSDPELDPDHKFQVTETITFYREDNAKRFMAEWRAAIAACPTHDGTTNKALGSMGYGLGNDSWLMRTLIPGQDENGDKVQLGVDHYTYTAAVRVDDMVLTVHGAGHSGQDVPQTHVEKLVRAAVKNLKAWRS